MSKNQENLFTYPNSQDMEINNWIKENIITGNKLNTKYKAIIQREDVIEDIIDKTNFLPHSVSLSERIFCIYKNYKNRPICLYDGCNNTTEYRNFRSGYKKYCCSSHQSLHLSWNRGLTKDTSDRVRENAFKIQQTLNNRDEEFWEKVVNKRMETCRELYNKDFFTQTDLFLEKTKNTFIEHYGVDNPSKDPGIKEILSNKSKGNKSRTGKPHTEETKLLMSESAKNRKYTPQRRLSALKNRMEIGKTDSFHPNYNLRACKIFWWIDYFLNSQSYSYYGSKNEGELFIPSLGYWIDYTNTKYKFFIEWNEKKHYTHEGFLREKDIKKYSELHGFFPEYTLIVLNEKNFDYNDPYLSSLVVLKEMMKQGILTN